MLEKNISCLQEQNVECMLQSIMEDGSRRDKVDKSRLISPLVPAKDAFIIDTSMIDPNELMSIVVKVIEGRN